MPAGRTIPRISVVVATYNRSASMRRTLESLVGMALDANLWEAVVIDNNSTDDTRRVFDEFISARKIGNMRMVFEPAQGLSHARNRGIAESRGEIIAVVDDDELVSPGFAGDYLAFFDSHPAAAAAGGKITPRYSGPRPRWMSRYTEVPVAGTLDLGPREREFPRGRNPFGGNMAFRRTTLEASGVFDPAFGRTGTKLLAGEEKELFHRIRSLGGKIWWVPGPEIFHIIDSDRLTRDYFKRLNYMGGVSERERTLSASRAKYTGRLASELVKWGASLLFAAGYCLAGQFSKARYLLLMRKYITEGLLRGEGGAK
ncbi:MAG: glycosyltransferase [Rikenellaceae bacterium]|nr:glycosyltransferase [Rikenellaceae bacterium]